MHVIQNHFSEWHMIIAQVLHGQIKPERDWRNNWSNKIYFNKFNDPVIWRSETDGPVDTGQPGILSGFLSEIIAKFAVCILVLLPNQAPYLHNLQPIRASRIRTSGLEELRKPEPTVCEKHANRTSIFHLA